MKTRLFAAALVGASLLGAPAALAVQSIELTPVGASGSMSGSFRDVGVEGTPFTDVFTFVLPTDGVMDATISSVFTKISENIDFLSVQLDGHDFKVEQTGQVEFRTLSSLFLRAGEHRIVVTGTNGGNGTFSGNLSFAAVVAGVPEPTTWALMIVGFGGAGAVLRRRNRLVARAAGC